MRQQDELVDPRRLQAVGLVLNARDGVENADVGTAGLEMAGTSSVTTPRIPNRSPPRSSTALGANSPRNAGSAPASTLVATIGKRGFSVGWVAPAISTGSPRKARPSSAGPRSNS